MSDKMIGVLAGMGPRSTSPFLELLLDQCQEQYGARYDMDYPHILIYSLPTPFYIDREINEAELKQAIREGLEKLQEWGADLIGIPCNTAHAYFDFITKNTSVPVLNMIDETVRGIPAGSKVTLFSTGMTRKSGLYQKGLREIGCEFLFREEWQKTVDEIIRGIKDGDDPEILRQMWKDLTAEARKAGAGKIIIGCTDLTVLSAGEESETDFIDSATALAKSLVRRYLEIR